MEIWLWSALILGSMAVGLAFVGLLVVRRGAEIAIATLGIAALALAAWAFLRINDVYPRVDASFYAFALGVAALGGGYALGSALLDRLASGTTPHEPRSGSSKPDSGVAVALLACTEAESYSPSVTASEISDLTEHGLLDAGLGIMPFLFTAQKARYRAAGGSSPAFRQLRDVADRLEELFAVEGVHVHAEPASCAGACELPEKVSALAERGFGTIVVAPYAVSDSLSMDAAMKRVDALRLEESGVRVSFAEALWGSDEITRMIADRVRAATAVVEQTGVVLVAHGQPDVKGLSSPAFDEHESVFVNRVRMHLVEGGFAEDHVRVAWSEWREPDVTATVRHLAALGCRRILVVPAVYPVESIGTVLDLPLSVKQARLDDWVSVVVLPAWRDDDAAVLALRRSVERAIPAGHASA